MCQCCKVLLIFVCDERLTPVEDIGAIDCVTCDVYISQILVPLGVILVVPTAIMIRFNSLNIPQLHQREPQYWFTLDQQLMIEKYPRLRCLRKWKVSYEPYKILIVIPKDYLPDR